VSSGIQPLALGRLLGAVNQGLAFVLSLPIRLYRITLSPLLPRGVCRFHPSCSAYALEALEVHGAVRGVLLTVWRLVRCQPFCTGGMDPVPPRRDRR
jgi:uncharacterized protein